MHRATSVYEPIPPDISSSRHRHSAVHGGGEAHSLSASDVQADRDVLLARCEIAEAYYRGGDSLALDLLASSSIRLYSHVIAGELSAIDLFDDLQECAANLGIAERGQDDVQAAIAYGPRRLWCRMNIAIASNDELDALRSAPGSLKTARPPVARYVQLGQPAAARSPMGH